MMLPKTSDRWEPEPLKADNPPCASGLVLKGKFHACDWPTDKDGNHFGWAHTSADAEAIWSN